MFSPSVGGDIRVRRETKKSLKIICKGKQHRFACFFVQAQIERHFVRRKDSREALQIFMLLDTSPDLSDNARSLIKGAPTRSYDWHLGVVGCGLMKVYQQSHHSDGTSYGEDVDRGGRLLANVDLLVSDVIHHGKSSGYANPAWEEETRILETTREREHKRSEICVTKVGCEQANHGRLWGIIDEPSGHQTVREEE